MARPKIDPDPFSIVVGAAGIVGGLASAVSLYQQFVKHSPATAVAKIKRVLREAKDLVRYVELDVQILQEIVADAEIPGNRVFRPGRRAFLSHEQFDRYEKTADQLMGRLRKILKSANRLDRLLPDSPGLDVPELTSTLESAQGRLERVLRDRDMTIDSAMQDLLEAIRQLKGMIDEVLASIEGPAGHRRR